MDGLSDNLLLVDVPDDHLVVNQELVVAGQGGRDPGVLLPHVLLDPGEPVPGHHPLSRELVGDLKTFYRIRKEVHEVVINSPKYQDNLLIILD